ncbi:MAG TPA: MFS transporter [Sphingomonadaceae bacterium]
MTHRHEDHRHSLLGVVAAIVAGAVAATPVTVQPGLVQGMVASLHMDEVTAGYVASSEVLGLTVAALLFAFVGGRVSWRILLAGGLLLMAAANLLSMLPIGLPTFIAIRIAAGFGAGLASAIGFAAVADTQNPKRNLGWLIAAVIAYSAIALAVIPYLLAISGFSAVVGAYAIASLACLPLAKFLVRSASPQEITAADGPARKLSFVHAVLAVAAVGLLLIGYCGAWTYMALLGQQNGIGENAVSSILSISQIFGVLGAMIVVWIGSRFNDLPEVVVVLLIGGAGTLAFAAPQTWALYMVLNCLFQFTWNAAQPLLLGVIATHDKDGVMMRFAIPAQYIGMSAGPALAAYLLGAQGHYAPIMLAAGLAVLLGLILILPLVIGRRHSTSQSLEASVVAARAPGFEAR